jgi:hypothetical protein
MYGGDSSDKEIYLGGARPKVSMDTGLGLSTTVLSASNNMQVYFINFKQHKSSKIYLRI